MAHLFFFLVNIWIITSLGQLFVTLLVELFWWHVYTFLVRMCLREWPGQDTDVVALVLIPTCRGGHH